SNGRTPGPGGVAALAGSDTTGSRPGTEGHAQHLGALGARRTRPASRAGAPTAPPPPPGRAVWGTAAVGPGCRRLARGAGRVQRARGARGTRSGQVWRTTTGLRGGKGGSHDG